MGPFRRTRVCGPPALVGTLIAGCGLDLPTPPNLEPLNEQYDQPTAVFNREKADELIATYTGQRARLARVGNLSDVRRLVSDFDRSVTTSEDGRAVEINGVPVKTDALATLYGRCEESERSTGDDIVAKVVIRKSTVVPVVWGDVEDCTVRPEDGSGTSEKARLWGAAEVFIPTLMTRETPIYLIAYDLSRVHIARLDEPGWMGSLRYIGETVELLVSDAAGDTVVLSGGPRPVVGVRAANGRWRCVVEEQRCEALDSADSSFSY